MMNALTGIRAFAAFWVVLYHFNIAPFYTSGFNALVPFLGHGYLGVDLFFILSGFVITHVHRRDFRTLQWPMIRRFYALRLARFYPLHLSVLLGLLAIVAIGPAVGFAATSPGHFTPWQFVSNLLLVQAWWRVESAWNYPAWSVSCEWFVYLLFPWIALALSSLKSRRAVLLCLACELALLALAYEVLFKHKMNILDKNDLPGIALCRIVLEFIAGGLLCRATELWRLSEVAWLPIAAGALLFTFVIDGPWLDFCIILSFLVFIAAGKYDDNLVSRFLALPLLVYMGEISYSLYMVHAPIQMTVGKLAGTLVANDHGITLKGVIAEAFMVCLTIAVAAATFHLIEAPARRWLRRRLIDSAATGGRTSHAFPESIGLRRS